MSGQAPTAADEDRARRRAERERLRRDPAAQRRRAVARRRALALGALAVVVLACVAVVAGTRGHDEAPLRAAAGGGAGAGSSTAAGGGAGSRDAAGGGGGAPAGHERHAGGPVVSGAAARRVRVPILMYHVIAAPPPGTPYPELWVPPDRFRAQLRALAAAGYQGVTLGAVFAAWRRGASLPAKPVVLTFDDGYRSHSAAAAPVLRALGWPGVLNLEINNAAPDGISLRRLRGLVRDGWEIDSHTVDHPDLTTLGPAALRDELVRSRAWIRSHLGEPAGYFCYPAGRFDDTVVAAVRAAGYRGATTELPGPASAGDDPYRLPRVRVSGSDSGAAVVAAARGRRGAR